MKIIKFPIVTLLITTLLIQINCGKSKFKSNYKLTESALKKGHKAQETTNQPINTINQTAKQPLTQLELNKDDLKDVPVYYETWIKYFKYLDEKTSQKPKHFFKNPSFELQGETKPLSEVYINDLD